MLQTALMFIKKKLDQYLTNQFEVEESITVLNHLISQDGSFPQKNQNKMVITLINLDYETNKQFYGAQQRVRESHVAQVNPSVLFNVDLLFTASFDDYEEALKFLNATIAFFQTFSTFNHKNMPDLPKGIKMLNFDIANASFFEIHNLWSAMGAKYQPSIIYKLRHVTVQSDEVKGFVPVVWHSHVQGVPE